MIISLEEANAREYGLSAVVGVENATKLIKDRQRICVHWELLDNSIRIFKILLNLFII